MKLHIFSLKIGLLKFSLVAGVLFVALFVGVASADAAVKTWDNTSGDGLWSTCTNWDTDTCPGSSDVATFDGTSNTTSSIDFAFNGTVSGIDINAGYTNTITNNRGGGITVGTRNFAIDSGTFNGGSSTIDINGTLTINGGEFISTSGQLLLQDDLAHNGGTFTHSNGIVNFDGAVTTASLSSASSLNLYNLSFTKSLGWDLSIGTGTITILNDFFVNPTGGSSLLTVGGLNRILNIGGDLTVFTDFSNTLVDLNFNGLTDQNITIDADDLSDINGEIFVNKSGGSLIMQSGWELNGSNQHLTVTSGVLDLNGQTLTVDGTDGIFSIGASGTLQMQGDETVNASPVFDPDAMLTYDGTVGPYTLKKFGANNLTINGSGAVFTPAVDQTLVNLTITAGTLSLNGKNLVVTGTFSNNGTLQLIGSEFVSLTGDADSGTIKYLGDAGADEDTYPVKGLTYYNLDINPTDALEIFAQSGTVGSNTIGSNLWAYWNLEEGTGTNILDQSGNAVNGVLTNSDSDEWAVGSSALNFTSNYALDFDGTNDIVIFTSDDAFVDRSYSLWFRASDVTTRQMLFEEGGGAVGTNIYLDGGSVYAGAWAGTIDNSWLTGTVSINTWTNVIFTIDADGSSELYVDGVKQGGFFTGGEMGAHVDNDAFGGCSGATKYHDGASCGGEYLNGEMDDVRIYSTVLTASEIYYLAQGDNDNQQSIANTALTINGDFILTTGNFTAPSGNMTIGDDFTGGANFTHGSGTLVFADNAQASLVSGSTTFNNLTSTTASKAITFTAGTTQTVNGLLTLTGGGVGTEVTLTSSISDTAWYLNVAGTSSVDYVSVRDSDASGGNAITHAVSADRSVNVANNVNWSFNVAPTVASVTGVLGTAGDGDLTITFIMDDGDNDDTLQAKIEYSLNGGSTWADPTLSTTGSETSATYGDPNIDNAQTYQVGQSGAYITSSSGANTVTIIWEAVTDILSTTDISNAQIRVTPYDGTEAGTVGTSANFVLDIVDPASLASFTNASTDAVNVTLTWTAATDTNFNHYEIWYGSGQSDVQGRTGTATEWDNSDDANLTTASIATTTITSDPRNKYFKIWAIDDYGNSSTLSDIFVTLTMSSSEVVGVPKNFTVTESELGATLSWDDPDDNTKYIQILRGIDPYPVDGTPFATVVVGTEYYFDTDVSAGDVVTYALRGKGNSEMSSLTETITVTIPSPETENKDGGSGVSGESDDDNLPDLALGNLSVSEDGTVTFVINNIGGGEVSDDMFAQIYVDDEIARAVKVSDLDTEYTSNLDISESGEYVVKVCVDTMDVIEESDEDNNCSSITFELIIAGPDLDSGDLLDALGLGIPDHWSENYMKNLSFEARVIQEVSTTLTFFTLLVDMFTGPNNGMNRGEVLQFLIVLADYTVTTSVVDTFSDVSAADERAYMIEFAAENGLVNGYPDGTFGQELIVNRAEALKMAAYFFDLDVDKELRGDDLLAAYNLDIDPFSDVDMGAWYAPYVVFAYANGVVNGYGDGTFGPGNEVTFAEFLKIATLMKDVENAVELAGELE